MTKACGICNREGKRVSFYNNTEKLFDRYNYCDRCHIQCAFCHYKVNQIRRADFRAGMTYMILECSNCGHTVNREGIAMLEENNKRKSILMDITPLGSVNKRSCV